MKLDLEYLRFFQRLAFFGLVSLLLNGCDTSKVDQQEAEKRAGQFVDLLVNKKFQQAAKLIDPKSPIYHNRYELMKGVQFDSVYGNLKAYDPMHFGGSSFTSVRSLASSFKSLRFNLELEYENDSLAEHHFILFELVNRGKDWKIKNFHRNEK